MRGVRKSMARQWNGASSRRLDDLAGAAAAFGGGRRRTGRRVDAAGLRADPEGRMLEIGADAERDDQGGRDQRDGEEQLAHRPYSSVSGTIEASLPLGQLALSRKALAGLR